MGADSRSQLGPKLSELARPQITSCERSRRLRPGGKINMHLVGPKLSAALAHMREVKGLSVLLAHADVQGLHSPIRLAARKHVGGLGQGWALDEAVDLVRIHAARGTLPDLLAQTMLWRAERLWS